MFEGQEVPWYLPQFEKWHRDKIKPLDDADLMRAKLNKPFCVTIYSYSGHKPFLKKCLESINKLGFYTILAYDNIVGNKVPIDAWLPDVEALSMVDSIVIKHRTTGGVNLPWVWHSRYTLPIIEEFDFKYVFSIGGDCYLETPERFGELVEVLGNYDMIAYWFSGPPIKARWLGIGTMAWICKVPVWRAMFDHVIKHWYNPKRSGGNVERRLGQAFYELGFTCAPTMNKIFDFRLTPGEYRGVFNDILGLRHLQWEYKHAQHYNAEPPEEGLMEHKLMKKGEILEQYYRTGDREYLEQWWDHGTKRRARDPY